MRSVGIRLGTEDKARVKADLQEIGQTGDAAFDRIAKKAKRSGEEAEAAVARAARDIQKLETLMPGLNPGKLDMYAGNRDTIGKSAESSAQVFAAAYAKMEARAEHLREVIDPLYAAQKRHNAAIGEARTLMAAGVISLDDYSKMAWHLNQSLNGTAEAGKKTGSAFAAAAPQIQDLFVQASMGGNVLQALVVQGGQLAGQLQYTEGRAGSFARFLMGPWGVAAQVALLVLSPFVSKLWEESEADKAAKKAKEEHRKAVLELADAQRQGILTAERKQAIDVANIKIELDATIAVRKRTEAELLAAKARLVAASKLSDNGADGGMDVATTVGATIDRQIAELTTALKSNASEIERLQKGFNIGFGRLVGMKVDAGNTASTRLDAQYQAARADAIENLSGARLAARLKEINAIRDREADAIKESTRARKADAETLTSGAVAKMLRDALPGVHVTSTTGGKHVKNSYHYRNQAVDFVPAGGVSSMTKADVRRIFESRGIDVVELLGPGDKGHSDHFHVAWTKGKLSLDEFNDAAKRTRGELKLLDDVLEGARGLDMTAIIGEQRQRYNDAVRQLVGDSDPLAGKIATGQEIVANDNADREVERRRLELGRDRIQSLASTYQQLFNSGTGSIWDLFRQQGYRTLSELLAKWTMGKDGTGVGGIVGSLGSLFGRGGGNAADTALGASITSQANAALAGLPKLASGTEYWSGGTALVGEQGPERAWLPRGTRVSPAGETRRASNDNPGKVENHYHFTGNVMTPEFFAMIQAGDDAAAIRGAAGGSAMAGAESAAAGTRRLGRPW